jgi:hypothetical protein
MTIGKQILGLFLAISIAWPFCACGHAESAEEAPAQHSCCSANTSTIDSAPDQPEPNDDKPCAHCEGEPADMAKMIQLAPPAESGAVAPPPAVVEITVHLMSAAVEPREIGHDPPPPRQQLLSAWLCVFRL